MQYKDRGVTLDRLELLWNGRGYPDKYKISLSSQVYSNYADAASIKVLKDTGIIPFSVASSKLAEYQPCKIGDDFGTSWHTHWFYVELAVPKAWIDAGSEVHFRWDSSSEAMIYNLDGKPLQGLTGGSERTSYVIYRKGVREDLNPTGKISLFVEMACCGLFGNFIGGNMLAGLDMNKTFKLNECRLGAFDREAWELLQDFKVLKDCAHYLDTNQNGRADEALVIANEILNICKPGDRSTYKPCRDLTKKFLSTANSTAQHTVYAVGHCHIDMAWLWPFSETRRKGGRSWSSQTELFKQYSPFTFCASSASLYDWVLEDYPLLFKEIQEFNKKGRFHHVGGSWLEFDGYVPSGESMARQMLYGQKFFKKHFGSYCDVFFLPDTFGYSAQLPQLIRLAGMQYFLTQKISWNRYNKFPHSSFNWKGIDGTSILTHFPPADTYCGSGDVEEILKSQTNFKDKGRSNSSLYLFGIGDGGGGPQPAMIDRLQTMKDVAGVPKVKMGSSVSEFFNHMKNESRDLMTWDGELYLELHNGSYTTMAHNKKYNRMCELLMRDAELFGTLRSIIIDKSSKNYNKDKYFNIWKKMMLFQFHDVLPGTCIRLVYEVTDKEYIAMIDELKLDIEASVKALAENFLEKKIVKDGNNNTLTLFNSLNFNRTEVIEWLYNGDTHYTPVTIKGLGCVALPISFLKKEEIIADRCKVTESGGIINVQTDLLDLKVSIGGRIVSLRDKKTIEYGDEKTMRELITKTEAFAEGGNAICIHDDVPIYWDAWDLWLYYQETKTVLTASSYKINRNQMRSKVCIEFTYKISDKSTLIQTMVIYADTKRIDFKTTVDWHEDHKILRTYFPLNLRSDFVTCDIQSGNLKRPTTANTSWEMAKYEVCSHKFVDMSEGSYGAALLNDCKYGYSARGNLLSMSLLKSSKSPNEIADMGRHEFTYAFYPHEHNFNGSDVAEEALKLNSPLYRLWLPTKLEDKDEIQYVKCDKSSIVLDAFKFSEEDGKSIILRMHENLGAECKNKIEFSFEVANATKVNILEEPMDEWEIIGKEPDEPLKTIFKTDPKQVFHQLKPFQIFTLKVNPKVLA